MLHIFLHNTDYHQLREDVLILNKGHQTQKDKSRTVFVFDYDWILFGRTQLLSIPIHNNIKFVCRGEVYPWGIIYENLFVSLV